MKDNFSIGSDQYQKFRPTYPPELFEFIHSLSAHKQSCWDCGTGNGQVAAELSKAFERVYATDISENQITQAPKIDNISYSVQPAEQTDFPDGLFDLVVVAQAIHWFDFEKFYSEVKRTCKQGAHLVVTGYGLHGIDDTIDPIIYDLYEGMLGTYWDEERRYIEQEYKTIPFHFEELPVPKFSVKYTWSRAQLIGYLNTWSSVRHFIKKNGFNPVDEFEKKLENVWSKNQQKEVTFPMLLRVGRINNS